MNQTLPVPRNILLYGRKNNKATASPISIWNNTEKLSPVLLRYKCHVTLCKFKVYMMIGYTYILQNDYYSKAS